MENCDPKTSVGRARFVLSLVITAELTIGSTRDAILRA